MDLFSLYAPVALESREFCLPSPTESCAGCGAALALRHIYKTLGLPEELSIKWHYPQSQQNPGAPCLEIKKDRKRGKTAIHIIIDNEADLPLQGIFFFKKPQIRAAEKKGYAYIATACPSYPFDLREKVKKAFNIPGNAYLHVLVPCPVGWKFPSNLTVKIGMWAVESGVFPLFEKISTKRHLTIEVKNLRPVVDYIKAQGRFSILSDERMKKIAEWVTRQYRLYKK